MSAQHPPDPVPELAPEDAARADLYALLARLFASGPDDRLLAAIGAAGERFGGANSDVGRAWGALVESSRLVDATQACVEHGELFVGTGQAPVSIYASHYLSETWKEHTLVELRDALPQMGLARQPGVTKPEDHLSALLEVMGHLVLRGDADAALAAQRGFFDRYLAPCCEAFCKSVEVKAKGQFYCVAARLLEAFLKLEEESLQLDC